MLVLGEWVSDAAMSPQHNVQVPAPPYPTQPAIYEYIYTNIITIIIILIIIAVVVVVTHYYNELLCIQYVCFDIEQQAPRCRQQQPHCVPHQVLQECASQCLGKTI